MKYLNLIIDNSNDNTDMIYMYASTIADLKAGDKVSVPFGMGNKEYDAYVHSVAEGPNPGIKKYKQVIEKDPFVALPKDAVMVCEWMRKRFFCRYIDAINCFTPPGPRPKRKSKKISVEEGVELLTPPTLTAEQKRAIDEITPYLRKDMHKVFLVHGVTSSGKTEVYINVIDKCINSGKNAVMLVPEISLTNQTISRFQKRFGQENIAVLHSKLSRVERYNEWMRIKNGEAKIVIGARSAVFAPFDNIGVIVLDEEHETTYKSDMSPKYETTEVAIKRAGLSGGVVLLGSATPSLTSAYRANQGEYKILHLKKRYNEAPLPSVEIVDMRDELKEGNKSIFSRDLYVKMKKCLDQKRQIILFLNRRGYSTFLSCRSCGHVIKCGECEISMTYHKQVERAVCHFCGKSTEAPRLCPSCGSKYIRYFGAGTEKVEEVSKQVFPNAGIERLDLDTARRKGSIENILRRFEKGETDILIGTQLVAKGLDFSNVGLVGIVSADITLNIPDYRSSERTFQLITQAAGRAGRGDELGEVVIQSYTPEHYAIEFGAKQDYIGFYKEEIKLRDKTNYPPFCDILYMILSAKTEKEASSAAGKVRDLFLRKVGKNHSQNVLGPREAPISKVGGLYRYQIFIKCKPEDWERYNKALWEIKRKVIREKQKEWNLAVDVNPFGFL